MNLILKIIRTAVGRWVDNVVGTMKLAAAIRYVAGVQKVRQGFVVLVGTFMLLLLTVCGFLLIHVALFLWLPWPLPVKAIILCGLGVMYLVIGLLTVFGFCSERAWMKFTRVDEIVDNLTKR